VNSVVLDDSCVGGPSYKNVFLSFFVIKFFFNVVKYWDKKKSRNEIDCAIVTDRPFSLL